MRFPTRLTIPAATLLALGACTDAVAPTALRPNVASSADVPLVTPLSGDRLATIEWEGSTPALYLQNLDGSNRVRVHFDHVSDHVSGNYSPKQLPVTDETIRRITRMKWSPDGRYLAVIVAPAYDASQVVLVTAEGVALRTVSPNSQYLWGDLDWSPDSRRIAYMMATGPYASRPDLFVTDLGSDQVTRVTTGARLSGYDTFRFDGSGQRILFTQHLGWADDGTNVLSQLASVDLATGSIATGESVVGEPQGFARDGSWALFIRWGGTDKGQRELFRLPVGGGREMVLASGNLWNAALLEGDREALLSGPLSDQTSELAYRVVGVEHPDDVHQKLVRTSGTTWAALWRALRTW